MTADQGESGNEAARRAFGEPTAPTSSPPPSPPQYPSASAPAPAFAAVASRPPGELSGWWRRAGALLLDGLVGAGLVLGVSFVIGVVFGLAGADPEGDAIAITASVVGIVLNLLYAPLLMARSGTNNGQTLGKQALGIRVVRTTGEPVTFWNGVLRTVVGQQLLGLVTIYIWALVDYLWPLVDKQNQALHDKIAKTWVVRTDGQRPAAGPEALPSSWLPPSPGA